ncbi:hypothetical protein GCM10025876_15840 [Demequina litorisediminis]|uniref:PurM-like C-terminal domain-containing protein n=1 Tax=Demequina litorisediminis TaxID=1849022 RepID=A0ABQ6IC80_9MICO|nr:hypothetical protein GCM10025876_15840 [Demequina litorisediminis]
MSAAQALFSETQGRVLVGVIREDEPRFTAMLEARGVPAVRIGYSVPEASLEVQGQFDLPLEEPAFGLVGDHSVPLRLSLHRDRSGASAATAPGRAVGSRCGRRCGRGPRARMVGPFRGTVGRRSGHV